VPRGTGLYDTAALQRRLWVPTELSPTMWFMADKGVNLPGTWRNFGTLSDATITGTAAVWAPNGIVNGTSRYKPCININSAAATTVGTVTGLPTSTFSGLLNTTVPTVQLAVGAATHNAVFEAAFPAIGVHLWNWANQTLTTNVTRVSWYNGTLLAAAPGGTTGATSGAGCVAFAGAQIAAGGGSLGRLISTSGGNSGLFNTAGGTRAGRIAWNEFISIDRQLNTVEQQKLEGYLAWKWGFQSKLAASHPYASRPPEIGQ
jgi:hypothetical protein